MMVQFPNNQSASSATGKLELKQSSVKVALDAGFGSKAPEYKILCKLPDVFLQHLIVALHSFWCCFTLTKLGGHWLVEKEAKKCDTYLLG